MRGSGVASAVTLSHTKGRGTGQGRLLGDGVTGGGCRKRDGSCCSGEIPDSKIEGKGGMD